MFAQEYHTLAAALSLSLSLVMWTWPVLFQLSPPSFIPPPPLVSSLFLPGYLTPSGRSLFVLILLLLCYKVWQRLRSKEDWGNFATSQVSFAQDMFNKTKLTDPPVHAQSVQT